MPGLESKGAVVYTNFLCGGESFATPIEYTVTGTGTGNYIVRKVLGTLEVGIVKTGSCLIWLYLTAIMKGGLDQYACFSFAVRDKTKKPLPPSIGDIFPAAAGARVMRIITTTPGRDFINNVDDVFFIGDLDNYGNTISEDDEIVLDVLFLQQDMFAGTNPITLYGYQYVIPYSIR